MGSWRNLTEACARSTSCEHSSIKESMLSNAEISKCVRVRDLPGVRGTLSPMRKIRDMRQEKNLEPKCTGHWVALESLSLYSACDAVGLKFRFSNRTHLKNWLKTTTQRMRPVRWSSSRKERKRPALQRKETPTHLRSFLLAPERTMLCRMSESTCNNPWSRGFYIAEGTFIVQNRPSPSCPAHSWQ